MELPRERRFHQNFRLFLLSIKTIELHINKPPIQHLLQKLIGSLFSVLVLHYISDFQSLFHLRISVNNFPKSIGTHGKFADFTTSYTVLFYKFYNSGFYTSKHCECVQELFGDADVLWFEDIARLKSIIMKNLFTTLC